MQGTARFKTSLPWSLTNYYNLVIRKIMRPEDLKVTRLERGWNQTQAAARLGVSQAYLNMLENGKRRLTPKLTRKFALTYRLSPVTLPVMREFVPTPVNEQHLAESLSRLGYPGFGHLHSHTLKK